MLYDNVVDVEKRMRREGKERKKKEGRVSWSDMTTVYHLEEGASREGASGCDRVPFGQLKMLNLARALTDETQV